MISEGSIQRDETRPSERKLGEDRTGVIAAEQTHLPATQTKTTTIRQPMTLNII